MKRIARVFPRKTNASPDDALSFFGEPGTLDIECDEVHVSVLFSYDRPKAEQLAKAWKKKIKQERGSDAT